MGTESSETAGFRPKKNLNLSILYLHEETQVQVLPTYMM